MLEGKGQLQEHWPTHQAISPFWKVGEARTDALPGTAEGPSEMQTQPLPSQRPGQWEGLSQGHTILQWRH